MKNNKILVAFVVVALAILGMFIFPKNNLDPENVTRQFYQKYLVDSDPESKESVGTKDYIEKQPFSKTFQVKLEKLFSPENSENIDFNPIVCAQDDMGYDKFLFQVKTQSKTSAVINVTEAFTPPLSWEVQLVLEGNQWVINEIDCPND